MLMCCLLPLECDDLHRRFGVMKKSGINFAIIIHYRGRGVGTEREREI